MYTATVHHWQCSHLPPITHGASLLLFFPPILSSSPSPPFPSPQPLHSSPPSSSSTSSSSPLPPLTPSVGYITLAAVRRPSAAPPRRVCRLGSPLVVWRRRRGWPRIRGSLRKWKGVCGARRIARRRGGICGCTYMYIYIYTYVHILLYIQSPPLSPQSLLLPLHPHFVPGSCSVKSTVAVIMPLQSAASSVVTSAKLFTHNVPGTALGGQRQAQREGQREGERGGEETD